MKLMSAISGIAMVGMVVSASAQTGIHVPSAAPSSLLLINNGVTPAVGIPVDENDNSDTDMESDLFAPANLAGTTAGGAAIGAGAGYGIAALLAGGAGFVLSNSGSGTVSASRNIGGANNSSTNGGTSGGDVSSLSSGSSSSSSSLNNAGSSFGLSGGSNFNSNEQPSSTPEPGTWALVIASAGTSIIGLRRRRNAK